jgi:hypothetical protein
VRPPAVHEVLATGFRTPEQTFHTFQIGWRGDEPDLERRCFSRDFCERNHVSRLTYREFRDRLIADEPFLRLGIADAELDGPAEIQGDRARLRAKSHGRHFTVRLVRDDVAEVYRDGERVLGESLSFEAHTLFQTRPEGGELLWGYVELPADLPKEADGRTISELRLAREWKIDDLQLTDGDALAP